jgi:hypothetical protein
MADGSLIAKDINPVITDEFSEFPRNLTQDGLINVLDRLDEAIVGHNAAHTPGIDHGILVLRGIRQSVEENKELSQVQIRHNLDSIDFHLRGNLHKVKVKEQV